MSHQRRLQLFGRRKEIAFLQQIFVSVLREGFFTLDGNNFYCHVDDCECTTPTDTTSATDEHHTSADSNAEICHICKDGPIYIGDDGEGGFRFVLVRGPAGIGRRSLLSASLSNCGCIKQKFPFVFVSGRFRSFCRNSVDFSKQRLFGAGRPFAAIDEAVGEMIQIFSENDEIVESVYQQLCTQLKYPDDLITLSEAIPSISKWLKLLQMPPHTNDLENNDQNSDSILLESRTSTFPPELQGTHFFAQQTQVWCPLLIQFLHAVARCIPVVLLLEDLQYVDESSLTLIKSLISFATSEEGLHQKKMSKGFVIVATCNDEDATPLPDSLISLLESCKDIATGAFTEIVNPGEAEISLLSENEEGPPSPICFQISLTKLTREDVHDWINACGGRISQCSTNKKREMTDLVLDRSHGNPLHIRYLLLHMEQEESIVNGAIHQMDLPDTLIDTYKAIFVKQDCFIQRLVQTASALSLFSENVCCNVLEESMEVPCHDMIAMANDLGLLEFSFRKQCVYFCSKDIQETVYDTNSSLNESLHLSIGRRVWRHALQSQDSTIKSDAQNIQNVLLASLHLRKCIDLLADIDERIYMSQLCYEMGQKSSTLGDFSTSAKLFEFSVFVLGSSVWQQDLYETSLVLHNASAQAYCSIGDYTNMERTLDAIFDHAATFRDKLPGYVVLVYALGSRNQLVEAFRLVCMALSELGEPVNKRPSSFYMLRCMSKSKRIVRGKSDRFLKSLPVSENLDFLILTQLFSLALIHTYVINPKASIVLCCRLVQMVVANGVTEPSSVVFAYYGFILCTIGDFYEGHRMGLLAIAYADTFRIWRPRVYVLVYGYIKHWVVPFRNCLQPIEQAKRASFLSGDLEIYAAAAMFYLLTAWNAGISLTILKSIAFTFCKDLSAFQLRKQLLVAIPVWSLLNDLSGETETLNLSGEINNDQTALMHCIREGNGYMSGSYYLQRSVWYWFIGEYELAIEMADLSFKHRRIVDSKLSFYDGLASLALARVSQSCSKQTYLKRGKRICSLFKKWSKHCPENFSNKQWLLEAEIQTIKENSTKAVFFYEKSIFKAREEKFVHEEAIAYERLGYYQRFFLSNNNDSFQSFVKAKTLYKNWGAFALANRIEKYLECT